MFVPPLVVKTIVSVPPSPTPGQTQTSLNDQTPSGGHLWPAPQVAVAPWCPIPFFFHRNSPGRPGGGRWGSRATNTSIRYQASLDGFPPGTPFLAYTYLSTKRSAGSSVRAGTSANVLSGGMQSRKSVCTNHMHDSCSRKKKTEMNTPCIVRKSVYVLGINTLNYVAYFKQKNRNEYSLYSTKKLT